MPQIFRMGEYWIYFWTNEIRRKDRDFCDKQDNKRRSVEAVKRI